MISHLQKWPPGEGLTKAKIPCKKNGQEKQ
jgi:hypothetical protein